MLIKCSLVNLKTLNSLDKIQKSAVTEISADGMAGVAGLEPVTSAVTGQRSNQLSYTPVKGNVNLGNGGGGVKFCLQFFPGWNVAKNGTCAVGEPCRVPVEKCARLVKSSRNACGQPNLCKIIER